MKAFMMNRRARAPSCMMMKTASRPTGLIRSLAKLIKFERRSEAGQATVFSGRSPGVLARKSAQRKD